jgi:hypothetical protein
MLFITHPLPKGVQIDEVVRIGGGTLTAVSAPHDAWGPSGNQTGAAEQDNAGAQKQG